MSFTQSARPPARSSRIRRSRVAVLLAAVATVAVLLSGYRSPELSTAALPTLLPRTPTGSSPAGAPPRTPDRATGEAEGAVPGDTTVFDDAVPGVGRLDPALLGALRAAATEAAADGVRLTVNSGWRSAAYQEGLLRDAIAKYGSREEAARWVAAPDRSAHVSGDAVDIGPAAAAAWLAEHGAAHGLCRTYDNEPWHFELRPGAVDDGCPATYPDAARDPRMQR